MNNLGFSKLFLPKVILYLTLIFTLTVVACILKPVLIIPSIIMLVTVFIYSTTENKITKKEILSYIKALSVNMNFSSKDALQNFPLPILVAEETGEIIWYNSLFSTLVEENKKTEVIKDTLIKILEQNDTQSTKNININAWIEDKYYLIFGNIVKTDNNKGKSKYIWVLYFLEETENKNVMIKFAESKPVVAVVTIDNYEEVMQNAEDISKPHILAEIDKKLSVWISPTGGIIKKFERDKYLCIFENKYLSGFEEKKFEIIDIVKEINIGNKIPVTLSMGIGLAADNFSDNLSSAMAALDVALGRGGDQVVIKNGEKYSFFGGRTKELERRTRVKARVVAHALRELINQSEQVIIMGHINADIDSLGAALGLLRVARTNGKHAHIVMNNSNIMVDSLMDKIEKDKEYHGAFITRNEALDKVHKKTLLIVVDTHRPSLTECPELLKFTDKVVVIDHHRRGTDFINDPVLAFHEVYASSTCELVTEIIHYLDGEKSLRPIEAEALYAGITIDTKNFTLKTGIRTFEAAAFLKKFGVDSMVVKQLFQNDLATYTARSEVVKNAELINEIAISICPENTKNSTLIAAQAADELLGISGIAASFVLSKVNELVSISGRSLGDINVQVILEKMGGGGHLTVAGSQIPDIDIEEAKEMLKKNIFEYLEDNSPPNPLSLQ
ncbi:MAG: DHH family phosphoesterase [Deltaproteobacteria bacterium]